MPTDGQTVMKKPIDAFRNFSKALKNPGKGPFVRNDSKWEDNIEKYFEEIGRELWSGINWLKM
jgi:hypothetical protein